MGNKCALSRLGRRGWCGKGSWYPSRRQLCVNIREHHTYLVVKRSLVNFIAGTWVTNDNNIIVRSQAVLALDLLVASIVAAVGTTDPDIDVSSAAVVEVIGTLLAVVLICFNQRHLQVLFPGLIVENGTYI